MSIGQFSPDHRFLWNGTDWEPVANPPPPVPTATGPANQLQRLQPGEIYVSAGTAFKLGFFGFLGAFTASIAFWVFGGIALLVFSTALAASCGHRT